MSTQTVTLTVRDQVLSPVAGVSLEIRRLSDDSLITTGVTNNSGQVVILELVSGSYYVLGSKALLLFSRQSVVVATDPLANILTGVGVPQAFILTGALASITLPSDPAMCRLYGFVRPSVLSYSPNPPHPGVYVTEEDKVGGGNGGTGYSALKERWLTMTVGFPSRGGVWEVDLRQGSVVTVSIPSLSFRKRVLIPAASTANLDDLLSILESDDLVPSS